MMKPYETRLVAELKAKPEHYGSAVNRKYSVHRSGGETYWFVITGDEFYGDVQPDNAFTSEDAAVKYAISYAEHEPAAMLHYSDLIIY